MNPWNIDALEEAEKLSTQKIFTILQLRHHEAIKVLKKKVEEGPADKIYDIDLTYLTSRGKWYYTSWKGDLNKSGGIATNIGVHFYDMLTWVFGALKSQTIHLHTHDRASGIMHLERANVRWFLSINYDVLPQKEKSDGKRTFRSITVDGEDIEFSRGFTELHSASYDAILNGNGYRIGDTREAIQIVHEIRHSYPQGLKGDYLSLIHISEPTRPY